MADTDRNPDGTVKAGGVLNPEGLNGHTAGWQRYDTRLRRFLEMSGDKLKALADDPVELGKLPVIDIGAIRHAKEIGYGSKMLDYLNAALDRLEGKPVQRNELTGKDGESISITDESRQLIRSKLLSPPTEGN
jgi:hypothetical protein